MKKRKSMRRIRWGRCRRGTKRRRRGEKRNGWIKTYQQSVLRHYTQPGQLPAQWLFHVSPTSAFSPSASQNLCLLSAGNLKPGCSVCRFHCLVNATDDTDVAVTQHGPISSACLHEMNMWSCDVSVTEGHSVRVQRCCSRIVDSKSVVNKTGKAMLNHVGLRTTTGILCCLTGILLFLFS